MKYPILTLLMFCLFGNLYGQQAAFGDGEKLTYAVTYSIGNVEAGKVVIRTSATSLDGTPVYNVFANAKVNPSFKWFYDLDDTYQTWLDRSTLKPLKFSFRLREGKHRANCDYWYDWDNMTVRTYYHNLKRPEGRERTMKLKRDSYDAVSLFFNMRSQDLSSFREGQSSQLNMVLEDTIRTIRYTFIGRESRSIKRVGTFKTLKFSCSIATSSGESFDDGSEFFLWVTDDRNKMPVYLESPIKIGSVRVTLINFENLKYPVDAKTK